MLVLLIFIIIVFFCVVLFELELMNLLLILEFVFLCLLGLVCFLTSDVYFGLLVISFSSCEAVVGLSFLLYFNKLFQGYVANVAE
uniref:NADH dehydrogenase subunit 4L n=1 Tax=Herdmania momus TaxID=7733 RepID=D1GKX8_HERMO|nr:NADH dehydrogenase subunit 4L [Herdmania momus]CAX65557.1 NADH dehydrogenase subunit 4L [Herdmania momus]